MVRNIPIDGVAVEKSRFLPRGLFTERDDCAGHLIASFEHMGILTPLVVYEDRDGQHHLVDGERRILYARRKKIPELMAVILPHSTPSTEIASILLHDKSREISSSVMNKVLFVCFALSLDVPRQWVLDTLCRAMGFAPHSEFLAECRKIEEMPGECKLFCHEKRFSLKQVINLANCPEDILLQLIRWRSSLQVTASVMEEISSNLRDYLKVRGMRLDEFVSDPVVSEIVQSSSNPHAKTEKLRQYIYAKRFPVLSSTNGRIRKKVTGMDLPDSITVRWDTSLENKNVELVIHVQRPEQWAKVLDTLRSKKTESSIREILDEL